MDFKALKPFVKEFVQYYYDELENGSGGYLHIVLDDGNIEKRNILFCMEKCKENNDSFGFFLATLLMHFTKDELQALSDDYFGM